MAGDWIKIEHATADKAEVLRIAELLGISRRECLGVLLDFWIWVDKNCNASVTLLSRKSCDDVTHVSGFAACLEDVGWAKFDDKTGKIALSNYERHNGNSAKSRALTQKRVKRLRNAFVTLETVPEKRREEKRSLSTNVDRERPPKNRLQEPNPEHQKLAQELGVVCQTEFLKYRDWLSTNGKRQKDEVAGFRNWLRRAAEWKPKDSGPGLQAAHLPAKMPELGPRTSMPQHISSVLSDFKRKSGA